MSVLSVLVYIVQGTVLRRGFSNRTPDDATCLATFSHALVNADWLRDSLKALEQSIDLQWQDVYDFVNPFGDRRGDIFSSVWTFDLDKDLLFLTKKDRFCSIYLKLARERTLTIDDFKLLSSPSQVFSEEGMLSEPYWEPRLTPSPRKKSFLGQVLRDFAHTWRHVLRRQMNATTFMKLAYATIWISTMQFDVSERVNFEYVTDGGSYVQLVDLPGWETPSTTLVRAGLSWFVLARNARDGLRIIRHHIDSNISYQDSTTNMVLYIILTLRHVILCRAIGNELSWTKPEPLFGEFLSPDTAIDVIFWAINTTTHQSKIHLLPVEIQDRILYYSTPSLIAAAKLGCELELGSSFLFVEDGIKIRVEERKRHRFEGSPTESQIVFNGVMSGLSYKRKHGYK